MTMHLDDWDKRIDIKLQDLDYCSGKMAFYSRHIQFLAQTLPMRPAWQTKARDELNKAETELRIALSIVQAAQRSYDHAPVIVEAAE